MPNRPEVSRRLAELMEQRRIELKLRWRDVAASAGISVEALRTIRNGTYSNMRPLTRQAIETGLSWEPGSVDRVLAGGDPVPLGAPVPLNGERRAAGPSPDDDHAVAERYLLGELGPPSEGWNRVTTPEERRMLLAVLDARRGQQARQQQAPQDERRYGT